MAVDGQLLFRSLLVVLAGVALIAIIFHYNKSIGNEGFAEAPFTPPVNNIAIPGFREEPRASSEEDLVVEAAPVPESKANPVADNFGNLKPEDLLPKLGNTKEEQQFAQLHPSGQGDVQGVNFLDAGSLVGQSTTLSRNSNLQLRTEPPIEKKSVSPWLMSTITAEPQFRTFEITPQV